MAVIVSGHTYLTTEKEKKGTLRAIKTRWGGTTFRSKNEARWDKIFDSLDVRRDYEPFGLFIPPSDEMYCPDYYIKDTGFLVDVKMDGESDESMKKSNIQAALKFFNDPANKGIIVPGYEDYPINGLLITPPKNYLNPFDGEYPEYHGRNSENENNMYNFLLKIMGVSEGDERFTTWSVENPNFEHIRRAVFTSIDSFFDHGDIPISIGYRRNFSSEVLIDEYGTDVIGQHEGDYLWDYMGKHQIRNL